MQYFHVEGSIGNSAESGKLLLSKPTKGKMWGVNSGFIVQDLG